MNSKFKTVWFEATAGWHEIQEGILKKQTVRRETTRKCDFEDFAKKLAQAYNELDSQGYDVVNVVPISVGTSEDTHLQTGPVAYSRTHAAVVVGRLRT